LFVTSTTRPVFRLNKLFFLATLLFSLIRAPDDLLFLSDSQLALRRLHYLWQERFCPSFSLFESTFVNCGSFAELSGYPWFVCSPFRRPESRRGEYRTPPWFSFYWLTTPSKFMSLEFLIVEPFAPPKRSKCLDRRSCFDLLSLPFSLLKPDVPRRLPRSTLGRSIANFEHWFCQ